MPFTVRYRFSQRFAVLAEQAYLWCIDFSSQDPQLMGNDDAKRQVVSVSEGSAFERCFLYATGEEVEKQKIVHLYPELEKVEFTWDTKLER